MSDEYNGVVGSNFPLNFQLSIFICWRQQVRSLVMISHGTLGHCGPSWPLCSKNVSFINGSKFNNSLEVRRTFNFNKSFVYFQQPVFLFIFN